MPAEDIVISCPKDARAHLLRIAIQSEKGFATFRQALFRMASGETEQVQFNELDGVQSLRNVRLFLNVAGEEPKVKVNWIIHGWDAKRDWDGWFIWKRSIDGWRQCVELAEKISPGHTQHFSTEADGSVIEVTM
jgi:hypothetical protein